jgi:isochorismate synthase
LKSIPLHAREEPGQHLSRRLTSELQSLPERVPEALLSITLDLGEIPWSRSPALEPGDFLWASPERELTLLGRGAHVVRSSNGAGRLNGLSRHLHEAAASWRHLDPDATGLEPLMFAAFAFDPQDPMEGRWAGFPNSALFLPEVLVHRERGRTRTVFSARHVPERGREWQMRRWQRLAEPVLQVPTAVTGASLGPAPRPLPAEPDDAAWLVLAQQALEAIESGEMQKLVLFRCRWLELGHPPNLQTLLEILRHSYPDCRLFATVHNDRTLVSASPERLLLKRARRVASDAVAGTARRSADPQADAALAQALRADPKTRREQALVAAAVTSALSPLCDRLAGDSQPGIRRLRNVQHLWNEIRGRLLGDHPLLEVAERLHPTPAVNGSPGPAALDWLRRHGQSRRGWYAGAGGWIDRCGDGELAVLLRCALLHGRRAALFAGAGLVAGSDPRAELAETELKLGALLHALARA